MTHAMAGQFGLIGRTLGHSLSPQIHRLLGDYAYTLFPMEVEALDAWLRTGDWQGCNVTIPYKETVIPYCQTLTERAKRIGAVNTLVRQADGSLLGDNTDYDGFLLMCERSGVAFQGKRCLVLGSGGASKTVKVVLEDLGADVVIVSRQGPVTYADLGKYADAKVIVNTTPVGTYPNVTESPLLSLDGFPQLEAVLDLIYNPAHTALMQMAEAKGILAINGLLMLVKQAAAAAERFVGVQTDAATVDRITRQIAQQFQNIVIVGMPGVGKTTTGRRIAKAMNREFVDLDIYIMETTGSTPAEIIEAQGEAAFRDVESRAIAEVAKQHGLVIATGGGTILREENRRVMRQNGIVVWLERDLRRLPTRHRPLSKKVGLETLYAQREPIYRAVSDVRIEATNVDSTVTRVLEALGVVAKE